MSPLMMALMALLTSRALNQGGRGNLAGTLGGALGSSQLGAARSVSDETLHDMLSAPPGGIGANPTGVDTSVLYPGGIPGNVASGVSDPGATLGSEPTDEMGGGFGGGSGGLGGILGGGLGSLVERFNRSGHGDIIGSWIGTGRNRAIAPRELEDALGDDTVDALSRETGMPREELLAELSDTLPEVVDRLTPDGRLPDGETTGRWA